jgi:mannose-6-phosphate isomerase-like protein (cupin superfamily)
MSLELTQDPHHTVEDERDLEAAIGRQVRSQRKKLGMTVGLTSPSLTTLKSLARALNVPFTALFQRFEEQRDATFVKAGEGLKIERRGTRAGHQYALLGHSVHKQVAVEPYMITLTHESEVFPLFQHDGQEFLLVVEGEMDYHHGGRTYRMAPGDSLFFDADAPHGPETLHSLPIRFLSVITYPREGE